MDKETDVDMIKDSAAAILAKWDAGESICCGLGGTLPVGATTVGYVERSYPEVNAGAFDEFAGVVCDYFPGGLVEQWVSFISVGYSKNGMILKATVSGLAK